MIPVCNFKPTQTDTMKAPRHLTAFIASLLLVLSPTAFGLGGDHKDYVPGESISHPDNWPQRLVKLASLPSRVAGYYINSDDYLAFKGDTAGFQTFLGTCVALSEFAPTTLHIHKGKGSFHPLDKEKKAVPCDWQLDVINQEWHSTEPEPAGPKNRLELHVSLDGAVDVPAIKVPPCVKTIKENDPPATGQAAPVAEAAPAKTPPQRMQLSNQKHAAVAVQTEKDVNFVLVHVGFLSTGMQDWVTNESFATSWGFLGKVHLKDKREIAVKYTSSEPDTLYLDGKAYALNTSGRIFILRDQGEPLQIERTLPLRNANDLVQLGALADAKLLELDATYQEKVEPADNESPTAKSIRSEAPKP